MSAFLKYEESPISKLWCVYTKEKKGDVFYAAFSSKEQALQSLYA
jgi:hypothetical protein